MNPRPSLHRHLLLPLIAGILAMTACSSWNAPGRHEAMSQIEKALLYGTAPGPGAAAQDYFPCHPYQRIAGLKFRTIVPRGPGIAVAIVQVNYEYTMSYLRVLDDLKAGKRAKSYGRVSSGFLTSAEDLHRHTFDKGGHFIVDGMFTFSRTDKGWQLQ